MDDIHEPKVFRRSGGVSYGIGAVGFELWMSAEADVAEPEFESKYAFRIFKELFE